MPRTATPAPLDDARYWRRLFKVAHPDRTGDHEMFLWVTALEEHVERCRCDHGTFSDRSENSTRQGRADRGRADRGRADRGEPTPRVPYPLRVDHVELTCRALRLGHEVAGPLGPVLLLLADYEQAASGRQQLAEQRGATYKQLRYLAALADVPPRELYEQAERMPLSQAMAGHLISTLKERAA